MLNAEKYRAEILGKDFKFGLSNRIYKCCYEECATCVFSLENNPNDGLSRACTIRKVKWLLSEYKEPVKLTKIEYYILKWAKENTEFKYLVRLKNGNLCAYSEKPFKDNQHNVWANKKNVNSRLSMFNDLFEFINCEDSEPTSIEEVLENCEVVDDAEE